MKNPKWLMSVGAILIAIIIGVILLRSSASNYYLTPGELMSKSNLVGNRYRVAGTVVDGSLRWKQSVAQLKFKIRYPKEKQILSVIYKGVPPSGMENDPQVIVEGTMSSNASFLADKILVRCPSRYLQEKATNGLFNLIGAEGVLYR